MKEPRIFLGGRVTMHTDDCREVLRGMEDNSVDSVVTDPPYCLTSITKRFGGKNASPAQHGKDGAFARASRGFMQKAWDNDVAFHSELWAEVLRVLKPGGYIMAFSGCRTYHHMACAIEDAGFITHPMFAFAFGSGFPKAHNLSKQLDKMVGAARTKVNATGSLHKNRLMNDDGWSKIGNDDALMDSHIPITDAAREWDGWFYGTQSVKPAIEPVYFGQKPFERGLNGAQNVMKWGTGAINVGACRIEGIKPQVTQGINGNATSFNVAKERRISGDPNEGRWPANLIHDGSDEVLACFPDRKTTWVNEDREFNGNGGFLGSSKPYGGGYDDSGSAARFFARFPQDDENISLCGLCGLPLNGKNDSSFECNANSAELNLQTKSILTDVSVRHDVAGSLVRGNAGNENLSNVHVKNVGHLSSQIHPLKCDSAQENVLDSLVSKIAQNVRSAAILCDSCATDIALTLAEVRRKGQLGRLHLKCSIDASKEIILSRSLASYVASRESTDIILTTTSLRELFGSVFHAIDENINSDGKELHGKFASKRLWYSAKADADDRLGSKHPTVKPLDLIQYLTRLITPRGGLCLDLFAGTGTAAEACFREGFRCILIENDPESIADIERRMSLVMEGPVTRANAGMKARGRPRDDGPLFASHDDLLDVKIELAKIAVATGCDIDVRLTKPGEAAE